MQDGVNMLLHQLSLVSIKSLELQESQSQLQKSQWSYICD